MAEGDQWYGSIPPAKIVEGQPTCPYCGKKMTATGRYGPGWYECKPCNYGYRFVKET